MRGFTRTLIWLAGILGAIGLLLYLLVFDVWVVPRGPDGQFAASILPALVPEDKIVIQRGRTPIYGELARCQSPVAAGVYVVGRVFGTPGDRVQVTDNTITTNGKGLAARHGCPPRVVAHPVTENLVTMSCGVAETGAWSFEYLSHPDYSSGTHSAIVEAGKVYLVSDNRLMHQDSRDFGQVDASTCEHIVFRLWGEKYTDGSRRFNVLW
ncbi:MAG TPA: S26 family signal peptidase [Labilithrix sp.]|nr:S26 family signal peptidase [Labilithrix sp.]